MASRCSIVSSLPERSGGAFQQRATVGKRLVDAKNGMSEPSWQAVRKRPALAMPADPACVFDSLLEAPLYCIDGRLD